MTSSWSTTRLADVLKIKHGYAFPGAGFSEDPALPTVVTPSNFRIGGGFRDAKVKTFNGQYDKAYVLRPGDVIVTMTDLSRNADTLGYAATVPQDGRTYLHNQRIGRICIVDSDNLDLRFAAFLLRTADYRAHVVGGASGSTVKHTSPSRIESYVAALPPLKEQRRIAAVLDSIEGLISANEASLSRVLSLSRSLYETLASRTSECHLISSVCDVNRERVRPGEGAVRYVEIGALGDGRVDIPQPIDWKAAPANARLSVPPGSTLWSTVRPNRRAHTLMVQPDRDIVASSAIAVLTPTSIGPAELFAATDRGEFVDQMVANAGGTAYPVIRPKRVASLTIPRLARSDSARFEKALWPMWLDADEGLAENARLSRTRDELMDLLLSGRIRVEDVEGVA